MKVKRKVYETTAEKRRDFWTGFGGWFAVNALMVGLAAGWYMLAGPHAGPGPQDFTAWAWASFLALLINLAGLGWSAIVRAFVFFGAIAAFALVLFLALCGLGAACFVSLGEF